MSFLFGLLKQLSTSGKVIIFLILVVFIVSVIVSIMIRRKYSRILHDLDSKHQRSTGLFKSALLNRIVEDYKNTAAGNYSEVNTQAIIEKSFNSKMKEYIIGERFTKNSVSILIILGLLGTFLGLTISVGELVKLLNQTNVTDIVNDSGYFIKGLISAVGGMAVAFITSLIGIACSIILTIFHIVFNAEEARENLMVHIEEYLDNTVSLVVSKDKESEYTMMNRILRETFIEFGEKIEATLKKTVETFGDKLSHVVMDVNLSSKALDSTVEKFDLSLKNFANNIRDFSEFNFNLKNNIERMDVSFIKVTEALNDTSKIILSNYDVMQGFSKEIRSAADEMTMYNKQVVQDVGSLVNEVKTTVLSIKELGEVLNSDMNARTGEMQHYQERFSTLMQKLSEEINTLGEQTAAAFSKSLAENGRAVSEKAMEGMQSVLREIFLMLDTFKENERLLAKTISMLPDQTLAYNETAVAKVNKQLEEVKSLISGQKGI